MKRMLVAICGIALTMLNGYSEPKPKADVYVRITDDLPKLVTGVMLYYNGILSVTNTGEIAFVVVADERCVGGTIFFYQESDNEEIQRNYEAAHGGQGKRWREEERKEVSEDYYSYIKEKLATVTLQPGENIALKCKFDFRRLPDAPTGVYKGEMYLGQDTWVPVHITPTPSVLGPVDWDRGKPTGDFYYAKEGTNQYLYIKMDDGKFKRAGEMKIGSRPQKEREENAVTFESPDGAKKKLTHAEARQIIQEREQQNN
jgi:hypothetical protein